MRVKIEFVSNQKNIILYPGYLSTIQGFIYENLSPVLAEKLHDKGFKNSTNRVFKLFNFSSILERAFYNRDRKFFKFPNRISFYLSSPLDYILEDFATTLINKNSIKLGENDLFIESIQVIKKIIPEKKSYKIKAITPIEIHSTMKTPDGKNFTHYYTPFDPKFSEMAAENLSRKWEAYCGEKIDSNFKIKPLFRNKNNEKILFFKKGEQKIVVKGWKGYFQIDCSDKKLVEFALNCGVGGRNSQGFGMIDIVRD